MTHSSGEPEPAAIPRPAVAPGTGRGREEAHRRVEQEIVREKAEVLGRAGARLERALAEVREVARKIQAATAAAAETVAALEREYDDARRRALAARHALLIQREAIGLRNHRLVDQEFPEPRARAVRRDVE